jgi:hypothetical protein
MDGFCDVPVCGKRELVHFMGEMFCPEHFIIHCYKQIDGCSASLRGNETWSSAGCTIQETLVEVADRATQLSLNAPGLSKMEQAQLLDILLNIGALFKSLRQ